MGVPIFGPLARKIFGTRNQRMVKRYLRVVAAVGKLEPSLRTLTDSELRERTELFRNRLKAGEKPFDIMPEVLAVAREAMDRAVGIRNIFNPESGFDPSTLPPEARALFDATKAQMDAAAPAEPVASLLGCTRPVPGWQLLDIPPALYEAVRALHPESRPPFRARPFDVQIIGGVVLSEGRIAEMRTGEGKTIVGPLACYLACCEGKQVHVVTVNDYLVQRDRDWTFPFFRALGLTVGAIHPMHMQGQEAKRAAYRCDVVYGTTAEFGFDYLRDNMKLRAEEQVQRRRDFAIVDEVDSILIDEARTPLIISGLAERQTPRYELADRIARQLVDRQKPWTAADEAVQACRIEISGLEGDVRNARDRAKVPELKRSLQAARERLPRLEKERDAHKQFFEVELDKKKAVLTHDGIGEAQRIAGMGSFYVGENIDMPHLLEQSIRAHVVYQRDRDYVVAPDEDGQTGVVIVDQNTGRKMVGRQWSDGLHQAVEAKEGVRIKEETQTMATITIQNYFKLYKRLAGMTGTADTEATEFHEIYRLDVVSIPTNKPIRRADREDLVFLGEKDKWNAILDEIARMHDAGRPVLVGTTSVEKSELLSGMLSKRFGIKHEVLNAKQHEREAEIVAGAGQLGAVMIATNMAGRGTDIKLGRVDRAALVEHWKRRNLAPREIDASASDEAILAAVHRHLLVTRAKVDRKEVAAMDDAAVRLELLRHWTLELRPVSEKRVAAMKEAELLKELDAHGGFRLHRLAMWTSVEAMGGLHIVGTERHESRRIDNQLRGRSGRQGDQGSSRFFLSLEDDLMKMFAGKATLGLLSKLGMKEGDSIEAPMLTRAVEKAQRKVEERNFTMRKNILEYDEPMEFQRRGFYGLRQPVLESRGVRECMLRFVEDCSRDAASLYMGPDHAGKCLAEWAREHFGVTMEPARFRRKEPAEAERMILNDAKEEAQGRIEIAVTEFMPTEGEAADFDASGLAKWAREAYACELDTDLVRAGDREAVRRSIEVAAAARFDAIDMGPVKTFLVEDFSVRELATWTERILGVQVAPERFQGIDGPEQAAEILVQEARKAYAERERNYGIDFAIEFTAAQIQAQNPQALPQFCAWAGNRYGLDWKPDAMPSTDPREIRRLLVDVAGTWDDTRFAARARECLEAGRDPTAIAQWFESKGLARLSERDLEDAAQDPETFVKARLREVHRAELTHFERWVLLQTLDNAWKDHLRAMDQIRDAIGFRAFSQKDPRIEFKKEAARLYEEMLEGVRDRVAEVALKGRLVPQVQAPPPAAGGEIPSADPQPSAAQQAALAAGEQAGNPAATAAPSEPVKRAPPAVVGRNEPCPCGSGKKFKHCHGLKEVEPKA
jgi:preprotein translocase subunit SecA